MAPRGVSPGGRARARRDRKRSGSQGRARHAASAPLRGVSLVHVVAAHGARPVAAPEADDTPAAAGGGPVLAAPPAVAAPVLATQQRESGPRPEPAGDCPQLRLVPHPSPPSTSGWREAGARPSATGNPHPNRQQMRWADEGVCPLCS